MKKQLLFANFFISGLYLSQVGINTTVPNATLDINGKNGITDIDGVIAPRLTRAQLTAKGNSLYGANQNGTIIYVTDVTGGDTAAQRINIISTGYHYFDSVANLWYKLASRTEAISVEPWQIAGSTTKATSNTQDIYQNGNVSIGDYSATSPTEKLDVSGNTRIRGLADGSNMSEFTRVMVAKPDGTLGYRTNTNWILDNIYDFTATTPVEYTAVNQTESNINIGMSLPISIPAGKQAKIIISYSVPLGYGGADAFIGYYGIRLVRDNVELAGGSRKFTVPPYIGGSVRMVSIGASTTDTITNNGTTPFITTITLLGYIENGQNKTVRFNMWDVPPNINFNWGRAYMEVQVFVKDL